MTKSSVSVAVLIAPGCHPNTGSPRASRGDAVAMALGHSLSGSALRVVHAGSPSDPALQDYLALGAGTIEVLPCGDDQNAVAAIAAYLSDVDVIVTGMRSELGAGSGLLPYQLAHALARPIVSNVLEAHISSSAVSGWEMEIRQFLPKGKRRRIAASLPVVIAVNPLAPVSMGYAHARRVTGKILAVPVPQPDNMQPGNLSSLQWAISTANSRPVKLKAADKKSGFARMTAATGSTSKGGAVAFEGTSVDKAQVVLNYLRENNLIDF